MGLDIYVGSLTRYATGAWETVVQKWARETGTPLTVIRTEGTVERPDAASAQSYILEWRSSLSEGLGKNIDEQLDWDERVDSPYFTDRPTWECYGSLLLWAAYDEHRELQRPSGLVKEWYEDRAFQSSREENFQTRYPNLLLDTEFWLPIDFTFTFAAPKPNGDSCSFGSSPALLRELHALNERTWAATEAELESWRRLSEVGTALDSSAQFGFALLWALATSSVQNRLPMLLDY
jgi:hypothetical protein